MRREIRLAKPRERATFRFRRGIVPCRTPEEVAMGDKKEKPVKPGSKTIKK
ncbi:hypothetical protein OB2597_06360 [Pseudooceanicola batsensis HTCC2597]|uniref:Uncharacterized protein n=1 Tax=Pseudooceanicola batsensis (strain ATCC BAA-863 / DSM 15984 / KCTC 12145 / HTCC2597) TaxID=252305 RepID=A3TTA7_PSEBH|nr:hypothetical protein [Pseudooceanicola batsensis]EAQ04884.1 hypothetical protein OB2597_06360 [Pseudooceanicola batsensis HTCC2597]